MVTGREPEGAFGVLVMLLLVLRVLTWRCSVYEN